MSFPFRNRIEHEGAEAAAGQYSILQSHFRHAARRPDVPARDLYRVARQRHVQDKVEHDVAYQLQEPLNSSRGCSSQGLCTGAR